MSGRIEGRNPVLEALKANREIDKLFIKKGGIEGSLKKIVHEAKRRGIVIKEVEKKRLDEMSQTGSHQGVIAMISEYKYAQVRDILDRAREKNEDPFIIMLDKITDNHNLGSIIRTANVMGAHGVIIPKHESASLGAVSAKASAGAVEFTPVAKVGNLSKEIDNLKKEGIWVYGADMDGDRLVYDADFSGGVCLVIGSEGEGISRLVKEKCDFLLKIPMRGEINSLNASVAAGIMMYEVAKKKFL
ncbi:MAG: 23S rRNA (guanosine(2251)-2'-O)-methyltransferase RlmB [Clostridiaceae bacterium]|nr:23S rRNA (guanosine(2251)-2'-O)-methyltransferase RlmB [Clostridiaceae bacterium]